MVLALLTCYAAMRSCCFLLVVCCSVCFVFDVLVASVVCNCRLLLFNNLLYTSGHWFFIVLLLLQQSVHCQFVIFKSGCRCHETRYRVSVVVFENVVEAFLS